MTPPVTTIYFMGDAGAAMVAWVCRVWLRAACRGGTEMGGQAVSASRLGRPRTQEGGIPAPPTVTLA